MSRCKRKVVCPYCKKLTPVHPSRRCSETGELMQYTTCDSCGCSIDKRAHPGSLYVELNTLNVKGRSDE